MFYYKKRKLTNTLDIKKTNEFISNWPESW